MKIYKWLDIRGLRPKDITGLRPVDIRGLRPEDNGEELAAPLLLQCYPVKMINVVKREV